MFSIKKVVLATSTVVVAWSIWKLVKKCNQKDHQEDHQDFSEIPFDWDEEVGSWCMINDALSYEETFGYYDQTPFGWGDKK